MHLDCPPIVGLNDYTEALFPRLICPVIFLPYCNLGCPFCINSSAVAPKGNQQMISVEEVLTHLKENNEDHICISGGEPCIYPGLPNLVDTLRTNGIRVGVSTNGTKPIMLRTLVEKHDLAFVAMDIKCSVMNYAKTATLLGGTYTPNEFASDVMTSLLFLLSVDPKEVSIEFRTTLYPPLVNDLDIRWIGKLLGKDASWVLQQFRSTADLLGGSVAAAVKPYEQAEVDRLLSLAKKMVPNTNLRWI